MDKNQININDLIIIRGGGDLATGVIQKFYRSNYKVLVLEVEKPTAIRRHVALCEAVYDKEYRVEDVTARRIESLSEIQECHDKKTVPIIVDPMGKSIDMLKPIAVVDAIIAKRNIGTNKKMAGITIAMGPGFSAGEDVDIVIETVRGHDLGRLIFEGRAIENTGIPGDICGKSEQRVLHAPIAGIIHNKKSIGDVVTQGDVVFKIADVEVKAPFTGLLRGLIRNAYDVEKNMKVADIDPRIDVEWTTISDKARNLGGAALEAFLYLQRRKDK